MLFVDLNLSFLGNHKRVNYSDQPRHEDNLNDPAAATINRALWLSHNSPYYERLMRRTLRQRYDPSSAGGPTPTITIFHRDERLCLLILQVPISIFEMPS
ncbi:hypothetical protein AVEN_225675-1 [Araneus ventricosus]|uniref:Uncharacterized protein n=1 Tax=Araneus ventricosus TaxID=182803 RepID=A0A4Y2NVV6_ARAVE|nr:hypothetical protein AVEN_225675-1 [Araneus ventricosus]